MKNGKEIFAMIYDDEISTEECIKIIHPDAEFYLLRDKFGEFDKKELMMSLLFKEYNFEIVNQQEVEVMLAEKQKQERIKQLEAELERLKGTK